MEKILEFIFMDFLNEVQRISKIKYLKYLMKLKLQETNIIKRQ